MPTTSLAVVVAITLIAGMFVTSVTALYRHRLVAASMFAAADFAAIHLALILSAWMELEEMRASGVPYYPYYPGLSSLSTIVYDAPAYMAIVFLVIAIAMVIVDKIRRRRG
ncbi:MAG: hypothetical protein NNC23_01440 [Candidatus Nanosynbacter sp. P2B_S1_bin.0.1]|nr:hypothetical protein [Candidatus Nanosynbacter sp. P2B_S1_bin.0.1]